jgi:hypothetical protein
MHMKNVTICLAALFTIGLVNPTLAARPLGKTNILHCGCAVDEADNLGMAYIDVNVSSRARGHAKHGNGTTDSCFDGVDAMVEFLRTASDCQKDSGDPSIAGVSLCELGETAGASCGAEMFE